MGAWVPLPMGRGTAPCMSGLRRLPANGFEIGYPEGWRDASQIVLIGIERPVFTPNVQVTREPLPDMPVEEFLQAQRAELSQLSGFRLLGHGDRTLGGRPALHHAYSWDLPDRPGVRIRQMQVTARRDHELFTVTCSALEDDWEQAEPGFELSLSAFAWT